MRSCSRRTWAARARRRWSWKRTVFQFAAIWSVLFRSPCSWGRRGWAVGSFNFWSSRKWRCGCAWGRAPCTRCFRCCLTAWWTPWTCSRGIAWRWPCPPCRPSSCGLPPRWCRSRSCFRDWNLTRRRGLGPGIPSFPAFTFKSIFISPGKSPIDPKTLKPKHTASNKYMRIYGEFSEIDGVWYKFSS